MRIIFIRHGDPDYKNDGLTPKGQREAALLAKRVAQWKDITQIYQSPLGRAQATAAPSLQALGREAITYDWLQEFHNNKNKICWDLLPEEFFNNTKYFDKDEWADSGLMKKGKVKQYYKTVCDGIDGILAQYGYTRNKQGFYDVAAPVPNRNWSDPVYKYHLQAIKDEYPKETTLVFFCHLGVIFAMLAYLTGLSPMQLWQGFYIAPTSITILNSEERIAGQACFRVERLGDTNHLTNGGEPISSSGYFAEVFRE
ncbi:MAG: histidine phosphatase family protein [Treponema sp.]|nr:histidine phosphatase family protein [Treponema sp.]